jgi:hypothetical protein
MKELARGISSSILEALSSFWWYDWVSAPEKHNKDYDACISKESRSFHSARGFNTN